jgi:hypothetical protein
MGASGSGPSSSGPGDTAPASPASRWAGPRTWTARWIERALHPTSTDLALWLVVVVAIATVEVAYRSSFIPPGGDSGHWVVTSYSFLGRAHPSDFTDQAFLYPPMTFVMLAPLVLLTNNPLTTSVLAGGLFLFLYGATSIHLARRYVATPSAQLLFVGLAVLNGTTLQILFWGGFPNFLAFSFLNEGMVFLLAAYRRPGMWEWAGVGVFASLLYLTHDLSFIVFVGAAISSGFLVLVRARGDLSLFLNWRVALAAGIFALAYGLNDLVSRLLGVSHPGYLFSNPATYVIDPIGLMFRPFYFAPAFFPSISAVVLSSSETIALLLGIAALLFLIAVGASLLRPKAIALPLLIVIGWLLATLVIPAGGYLAHVDTDYPRFAYFFPLPVALGATLLGEWTVPRWRDRSARSEGAPRAAPAPTRTPLPVKFRRSDLGPAVGVALVLAVLYVSVTLPAVIRAENGFVNPTHASDFVAAAEWIGKQPGSGAILTDSAAARWAEALSGRAAFSSGPTWLHFYTQQILDDNLAYWALSAHYVATDNHAALAYSGYNRSNLDAFPQYVAYLEGVPFPVLRLSESTLTVTYSTPRNASVTDTYSSAWGTPQFFLSPTAATLTARFVEQNFTLNETSTLEGNGTGTVQLYVLPSPGVQLHTLSFQLATPTVAALSGTLPLAGIGYSGSGARNFTWSVRGSVGALPGTTTLTTAGTFSMAPDVTRSYTSPAIHPTHLLVTFDTPASGVLLQLRLSAPGLSDPAITLPTTFDSHAFLAQNDIQFLLVQNTTQELSTASYFESEFGFALSFANPQWVVLED